MQSQPAGGNLDHSADVPSLQWLSELDLAGAHPPKSQLGYRAWGEVPEESQGLAPLIYDLLGLRAVRHKRQLVA